jgi:hypothetical protein
MFAVTISAAGAVAGAAVASAVYAASSAAGDVAASASGAGIDMAATLASMGVGVLAGDAAASVVYAAGKVAAHTTRHAVRAGSSTAAAVSATAAGAGTALAVTAGGYAVRAGTGAVVSLASKAVDAVAASRAGRQDGLGDAGAWEGCDGELAQLPLVDPPSPSPNSVSSASARAAAAAATATADDAAGGAVRGEMAGSSDSSLSGHGGAGAVASSAGAVMAPLGADDPLRSGRLAITGSAADYAERTLVEPYVLVPRPAVAAMAGAARHGPWPGRTAADSK